MVNIYTKGLRGLIAVIFFIFFAHLQAIAQNEVAIGSATTKSNAILWLNGNKSQGLILPYVTSKSAVSGPDKGMIVYDESDNKVWYRSDNAWVEVGGSAGGGAQSLNLQLTGNQLQLRDGTTTLSTVNIAGGTQTNGGFMVFTGGSWQYAALSGDVTGTNGALLVEGIKGKTLPALPTTTQVLVYDGTDWKFQPLTVGTDSQDLSLNSATNTLSLTNDATPVDLTPYKQNLTLTGTTLGITGGNSVTLPVLGTGTVTSVTAGNGLAGGTITTAGTISIASGGVGATELADNAVVTNKIQDNAVTTSKINNGAVDNTKLADNAVTNTKIASGANIDISKLNGGAPNNNKVLKVIGGVVTYADDEIGVAGTGDITDVIAGTGLTGGATTGAATLSLSNTAVTPAPYGSATAIPQITVDAQGRITNATTVAPADNSATNELQNLSFTGTGSAATGESFPLNISSGTGVTIREGTNVQIDQAANVITINSVAGGSGTVTSVTGTAPISVATGTTTPVISIAQANTTTNGFLSSADWNTFNAKGTGTVTSVGLTMPAIFTVTNSPVTASGTLTTALVSQTAATVFAAPAGTAGVPVFRALTGTDIPNLDAAKITAGILSIARGGTGLTAAPVNGQLMIGNGAGYTLSTLTAGTGVNIANGAGSITISATGLANPMTAPGDIIYGGAAGAATRLATGAGFLKGGATPSYAAIDLATSDVTGVLPLTNGGTGSTNAAGARTSLGLGTLSTLSAVTSTEITDGSITNIDILNVDASKITTGTLPVARGGTNATAIPTNGGVSYGTGTAYAFTPAGTSGQLLQSNGAAAPTWVNPFANPMTTQGDIIVGGAAGAANRLPSPGASRAILGYNGTIPTWVTGSPNQLLGTDGVGDLNFINQSGFLNIASTAGGDLTGTFANLQLAPLAIVNADIATAAAIDGTKVNPDFGVQNISTTGTLTTGTVGIGTTAPLVSLSVIGKTYVGGNGDTGYSGNTFPPTIDLTIDDSDTGLDVPADGELAVYSNDQEQMRIVVGGVGIGTTTPTERLHVAGNIRFSGALMPNNLPGTAGQVLTSAGPGAPPSWQPAGAGSGWTLLGNGGTSATTNFIGTTDNVALNFRVNNVAAGRIDPALQNTFFGQNSGRLATTGANNIGYGYNSLSVLTSGAENTALGYKALESNIASSLNTAVGKSALFSMAFANGGTAYNSANTAVGYHSLYSTNPSTTSNGARNTAIGYFAGFENTTGTNNVFIGYGAGPTVGTLTNATAIGYNAKVAASNAVILGGTGADGVNVAIGTTTPSAFPLTIQRFGGNTGLIWFNDAAGVFQGSITLSGATVSYNAFTGSHIGSLVDGDEPLMGTLITMTGEMVRSNGDESEPIYQVKESIVPNDPKILGTYNGKEDGLKNASLIMAAGNGEVWVVDNGSDLEVGDFLISSEIKGHAMKEDGTFEVAHVFAKVAEPVKWSEVTESFQGRKHKRISVLFETFVRNNKAESLSIDLENTKKEVELLRKEMETIKSILGIEAKNTIQKKD